MQKLKYTVKKKIIQDNQHVGYLCYDNSGCFKTLHFVGYIWFEKDLFWGLKCRIT